MSTVGKEVRFEYEGHTFVVAKVDSVNEETGERHTVGYKVSCEDKVDDQTVLDAVAFCIFNLLEGSADVVRVEGEERVSHGEFLHE